MIILKKHNENKYASAKELHRKLGLDKSNFSQWIKRVLINKPFIKDKDFTLFSTKSTGGRPSIDYLLTEQTAISVIMISGGKKAHEIRLEVVKAFQQKQNLDLLTHDQVIYLSLLKSFFKYSENQKDIAKQHVNKFAKESNLKNPYAEFHLMRNNALNIDTNTINQNIKDFCIEHQKTLPKYVNSKRSKIQFLDMYENLKIAVWDFLSIKGIVNKEKLSELVKKMAQTENLELFVKNETNLFQKKENLDLKAIR